MLCWGNATPMRSSQSNLHQACRAFTTFFQPPPGALTLSALRDANAMHSSQWRGLLYSKFQAAFTPNIQSHPHPQCSARRQRDAQAGGSTQRLLTGGQDKVDAPVIHAQLLSPNGADTIDLHRKRTAQSLLDD